MSPATNKTPISSSLAPPPSAYLSSAISAPLAGLVYASGSCGIKDGKFIEGTVKDRTIQALKNVEALLKEAGLGLEDGESSLYRRRPFRGEGRSSEVGERGRREGGREDRGKVELSSNLRTSNDEGRSPGKTAVVESSSFLPFSSLRAKTPL